MVSLLSPAELWRVIRGVVPEFDVDKDVFVKRVKSSSGGGFGGNWGKLRFKDEDWIVVHVCDTDTGVGDISVYGGGGLIELLNDKIGIALKVYRKDEWLTYRKHCLFDPAVRVWEGVSGWGIPSSVPTREEYFVWDKSTRWRKAAGMACDTNTPGDVLGRMVRFKDPVVAALAVHNPNCPDWAKVEYELTERRKDLENVL